MNRYRYFLVAILFGLFSVSCMSSQIQWVNPQDPNDDGKYAKRMCDVELGLVGSPEEGATQDERDWNYRAFSYPEDLRRCMERKGYRMGSTR